MYRYNNSLLIIRLMRFWKLYFNLRLFIRGKYRGENFWFIAVDIKNSSRYYINIKYFVYLLRDKFFNISLWYFYSDLVQVWKLVGCVDSLLKMKYYIYFILQKYTSHDLGISARRITIIQKCDNFEDSDTSGERSLKRFSVCSEISSRKKLIV